MGAQLNGQTEERAAPDLLAAFGARLADLRRTKGLSREHLAHRAGISARFLADVESGRGNIALSRLLDLCSALDTPLAVLAAGLQGTAAGIEAQAGHSPAGAFSSLLTLLRQCSPEQLEQVKLWLTQFVQSPRPIVALIGLRGAGKTTIGKKVAARLRWRFVELDELIEKRAGVRLQNIFELHGEEYYRQLEHEAVREFLAEAAPAVLATGGGIVTNRDAYELIRQHSLTFWLRAEPAEHWSRVLRQDPRPMVNVPNAFAHLKELLQSRESLYSRARWTVDTSQLGVAGSVDQIVSTSRAELKN